MARNTEKSERAERLSRPQRHAQILDSAVALIVARGLSSCSLEEVAAEAGISKPLIYKYFSSREELLKAILEREYRYLRGRGLGVLPADLPYEALLRGAIQRSMEYLYERGPIMRLLASDRAVAGLIQNRDRDERAGMTRFFSDAAIRRFGLSPVDALIITILTVNAPILSARALKQRGIPVARAAEVWGDFILGGLEALQKKAGKPRKAPTKARAAKG
ncbi:MAG TPA: helix-turn-helix domain-containing protein [Rhizomicrobium sp.]|jgi:AcrR family transcriptional regulator|nr:helix-turn-helix domain-containing protein [Rhizomicrobium sp.]